MAITFSRFCTVIDLNDTYRMMITMQIMRFCMVIDLNDIYRS